jgi:hypothetical protein
MPQQQGRRRHRETIPPNIAPIVSEMIGRLARRAPVIRTIIPQQSTEAVSCIVQKKRSQTQKISDPL